jgi:glycosyltransferase involved in cell wall biosynthesis
MKTMTKLSISVIILTYNEEKNIEECLRSVYGWADEIFIVDSYSTDRTLEIARRYANKIYQHPFETQAKQFNWALDNLPISTEWIMRLDADERLTSELCNELREKLPSMPEEVTGLYVKRRVYFMGRWIKHGGYYPIWLLRIFRRGKGRCEERLMDEHIVVTEGKTIQLKNDIIDYNRKGLSFWIEKHNQFATREMLDILAIGSHQNVSNLTINASLKGFQGSQKRWLKQNFYLKLPLFFRAFLYFIYRYFFRLGFLDGKEGLIFHFLQGFWYRFLVDAKIYEYRKSLFVNRKS